MLPVALIAALPKILPFTVTLLLNVTVLSVLKLVDQPLPGTLATDILATYIRIGIVLAVPFVELTKRASVLAKPACRPIN